MRGERKHGLYSLEGEVVVGLVALVSIRNMSRTKLWHKRLGQVSERGLVELCKQGLLCGDKVEKLNFREHRVYGKACRTKFGVGQQRTKGTLDLIHIDLWGPSRILSHSGTRYFLTCVDNFSRKLWIHILKTKNEVCETFKNWKTMIENQAERKIKRFHTDNGLEFCSNFFNDYCKKMGIARHNKSVARTPQQNGLAERFNRTIL